MSIKIKIDDMEFVLGTVGENGMHDSHSGNPFDPSNVSDTQNAVDSADFVLGSDMSSKFWLLPGEKITCGKNTLTCTGVGRHGQGSNLWEINGEIYLDQFKQTYEFCFSQDKKPFFTGITNLGSGTSFLSGCYIFSYETDDKLYIGCPIRVDKDFKYTAPNQNSNIYMSYTKTDGKWIPDYLPGPDSGGAQFPYTKCFFWFIVGSLSDSGGNPYEPGGPSGPGGGGGNFDDESDPIGIPPLPTLSSAHTGFTRIYNPTLSQVNQLANYLWTEPSVIDTIWNHIKQFFENPMDAIIGFNIVPVPVPDGGTENFRLLYIDTGVPMIVAANQFVDIDCGNLSIEPYYGSALDHSPYTKISCFLPFIGTVSLNVDEVMGTTLKVAYRVDICSGSCVAYITVNNTAMYQYSGHCAVPIPLASADFSSYVNAAISVAKLAGAAITAGAGAAMAAGVAEASQQTNQVVTTTQVTNTTRNPSTGRQITTGTTTTVQTRESPADQSSTQASFSGLSPQNVANTVGAIMSSKPHIEHSGSFSGNSGYLGVRRPFLIIERPNMCMPSNYQALNGFPAMITMELSTCKGFTRVQQVQLTGMGRATNPEQAEIMELLKSGVIL